MIDINEVHAARVGYGELLKPDRVPKQRRGDTSMLRRIAHDQAGGRCQADGLHHLDCPQHVDNGGVFVAHHIWPTSMGGTDDPTNLLWVWNGLTGLGAGGCHGKSHTFSSVARSLGLLRLSEYDQLFGIGIDQAVVDGWFSKEALRSVRAL